MTRVFIGNLATEANEDDVSQACSKLGHITDVWVATDPAGFAFVTFEEDFHAEEVEQGLRDTLIKVQPIRAELSKKRSRKLDIDCEIVVAVASKSKPKLEAAQAGFARMLPPKYILKMETIDVPSGVPAQPIGMDETRKGALNRLAAARASEVGRNAHFCIAFEGGLEDDCTGRKVCFAVVCIQFRDDNYVSEARSATHSLPPGIESLVDQCQELGIATDSFFAEHLPPGYGKASGGTIGALTVGVVDRVEFYAQPAVLALVQFVNAKAYGITIANPFASHV